MKISVVVITHNERPRLRLTLESLACQVLAGDVEMETLVVDDGSTDGTRELLADVAESGRVRVVTHEKAQGRSPSRNDGARTASGDVVLFLDGDVLAAPDLVARHARVHHEHPSAMGRGETWHLRCTRSFHDPEVGSPMPGEEARVARMTEKERAAALVTREQIRERFEEVARRGEPGIYSGSGPRLLYELEMRALHATPDASILWMAASGHNFSVRREAFLSARGFHPEISINEHRELALRLCGRGGRVVAVDGARSFHLLHRAGFRDPATETDWERAFYRAHPSIATRLMNVFWLSLAGDKLIPEDARILSLEQLEAIVRDGTTFDYDALRRDHPKLAVLD